MYLVSTPDYPHAGPSKSRVLVVDDHAVVRCGLVTLINEQADLEVCGEAANEADALDAFRGTTPDLLLVDWSLKRRDSSQLLATLQREFAGLKALVLSIHDEATHAELALQAGAAGYIMKREAAEKLLDGIRSVLAGSFYLSERALGALSPRTLERVSRASVVRAEGWQNAWNRTGDPFANWAVSVVIPVFNSEKTLEPLCEGLLRELAGVGELQIVLVDDGSTDRSAAVCVELQRRYPAVLEFVGLARNFGEHNALLAGIQHATGDYCVLMDDDLQNPPGEVRVLLREIAGGFDLVYARYRQRCHPLYRRLGSWLQDWTARLVLRKPAGLYLSSFKVFSSRVRREVSRCRNGAPYLDALLLGATRNIGTVECDHRERAAGRSGYSLLKLVGLWSRLAFGCSEWLRRRWNTGSPFVVARHEPRHRVKTDTAAESEAAQFKTHEAV